MHDNPTVPLDFSDLPDELAEIPLRRDHAVDGERVPSIVSWSYGTPDSMTPRNTLTISRRAPRLIMFSVRFSGMEYWTRIDFGDLTSR